MPSNPSVNQVVRTMFEEGVSNTTDFEWISQLRYYWEPEGALGPHGVSSARNGKQGSVLCRMITAAQYYCFEYLGNSMRCVSISNS